MRKGKKKCLTTYFNTNKKAVWEAAESHPPAEDKLSLCVGSDLSHYKPYPSPHPLTLTHTHPNAAKKNATPTHTQPKKGHTHPHLAKKRPHPPTPSLKKGHPHPHPAKKWSYPPKSSRKAMEKKIFHYPLVNQIYQKLKKP